MPTLWTLGHSTHTLDAFAQILRAHAIEIVADVRCFPGSRRHPQFGPGLPAALAEAGIGYRHVEALGGRRRPLPDSRNGVWRSEGFRGYADHMASPAYRGAFAELAALASERRCVVMCAERLWWQCHRALLADDFALHGWQVVHVLDADTTAPHAFREPARLDGDVPVYGDAQASLF
jgi:uncharacterized protein (DUF488 family)